MGWDVSDLRTYATQVRDRRDLTDRPRFVTAVRAGRMVP